MSEVSDGVGLAPEYAAKTVEHMFELWVYPELERRSLPQERSSVRSALVVIKRDQAPQVLLNGEFEIHAQVRATRAVEYGEPITAADFSDVESVVPVGVDEDAAWITFVALPDGRTLLAFDFRYELGRAHKLLDLASGYMRAAKFALEDGAVATAIENALAAAELAVMIQMRLHLMGEDRRDRHASRYRWFDNWAQLGNIPDHHAKALRRLAQLRGWARYGEDGPGSRLGEAEDLCRAASELVEGTRELVAQKPR